MLGSICCPLFLGLVVSFARVAISLHFAIYHPIVFLQSFLPPRSFAASRAFRSSFGLPSIDANMNCPLSRLRKMWLRRLCSGLYIRQLSVPVFLYLDFRFGKYWEDILALDVHTRRCFLHSSRPLINTTWL